MKESLNLLFFDSKYPRLFVMATVDSFLGFRVPYMEAAEVLCKTFIDGWYNN